MSTKICISTLALLFATLILPFSASAQNTRYKLIDLGTLGGPNSGLSGPGVQTLNNGGTFAGYANTATPNPNPGCFIAFGPTDCFVEHPFVWQNGTVATLPVLPGGNNTAPSWISSSGLIAGASENGLIDPMTGLPEIHAVLWPKDRQIIDLGTVTGGTQSLATSINSRGQIVGFSNNDVLDPFSLAGFPFATQTRAFLWQNGAIQDLGTLGGPDAFPNDINEQGQIAGMSYTNSTPNPTTAVPTLDPFLWEGGTMIDLGTLGGTLGVESWLNSRGQVVGTMNLAGDVNSHGFLWDRGSLLDLGTLGGNNSQANWINDAGHIVGSADLPSNPLGCTGRTCLHHAFLWKNGVMTDLGVVSPGPCSTAISVNSKDQVLSDTGICGVGGGPPGFSEHGQPMVDINTLVLPGSGLQVVEMFDINDRGEIAGVGALPNGDMHAILLVPASEREIADANALGVTPSTFAMANAPIRNAENSASRGRAGADSLAVRQRRRFP